MRLLKQRIKIQAPVEHVYACCNDFDYFKDELIRHAKASEQAMRATSKGQLFEVGSEIALASKNHLITAVVVENIPNQRMRLSITPDERYLSYFGRGIIEARFFTEASVTVIEVVVESEKRPSLLWRIAIPIMILFMKWSSRKDEKRFIDHVESTMPQSE